MSSVLKTGRCISLDGLQIHSMKHYRNTKQRAYDTEADNGWNCRCSGQIEII